MASHLQEIGQTGNPNLHLKIPDRQIYSIDFLLLDCLWNMNPYIMTL